MALSAGTRLGPYEILEPLGAGGMGEVYRAHDQKLDRDIALKVLSEGALGDDEARKRFRKEAHALSRLSHPHIATILDFDTQDGTDYLAMELVRGHSLRDELDARGPLPEKAVVRVGAQIAHGLQAAHEQGVIHRDLKPSNLQLTPDGLIKILDFGLARLMATGPQNEHTAPTETAVGRAAGTLPYMSPEQLRGRGVDARTDLYALGAVLYELATGRRLFTKESAAELTEAILGEEPTAPRAVNERITPGLEAVILKALDKDPELRHQTARDLLVDLERLQQRPDSRRSASVVSDGPPAGETPAPSSAPATGTAGAASVPVSSATSAPSQTVAMPAAAARRKRLVAALAAVAVLAAAGVALWKRPWKATPELDPKRVAVAPFENRPGDPSLDNLGRMAAESVSQALQQIDTIQVVPSATAFELAARTRPSRDPIRALAEATAAGTVVTGALYLHGETLQVRGDITDVVTGEPLWVIEPAEGSRAGALETVGMIRERVLAVVAARYLNPFVNLLVEEVEPPPLEAQKEFLHGFVMFGSDLAAAQLHAERAVELAPRFAAARHMLHTVVRNQGRFAEAEAPLDALAKMQERLTPLMRRRVDQARANLAGRLEAWYAASADIVRLSPSPGLGEAGELVITALAANRPRAAVEVNATHSLLESYLDPSAPFGAFYVMTLTGALHQLGEHEEELQTARRGKETYPHLLNLHAYEARALVALGRIVEAERLVDDILAMASQWAWPSCCLPKATPGYVMVCTAEEMRTHGHRDATLKMAGRAADWYGDRVGQEAQQEETRANRAEALYRAERWDEAKAVFAALAREHPDNIDYLGRLGSLAARRGDSAEALRYAERLRTLDRPYLWGNQTYRSARILALLGDKEGATARLREAVAQGSGGSDKPDQYGYGFIYRHAMDLEPLGAYPAFEELIKPKG